MVVKFYQLKQRRTLGSRKRSVRKGRGITPLHLPEFWQLASHSINTPVDLLEDCGESASRPAQHYQVGR